MVGTETGIAVPGWELGGLGLHNADASEVVSVVALGTGNGLLPVVDMLACVTEELIPISCLAALYEVGTQPSLEEGTHPTWCVRLAAVSGVGGS